MDGHPYTYERISIGRPYFYRADRRYKFIQQPCSVLYRYSMYTGQAGVETIFYVGHTHPRACVGRARSLISPVRTNTRSLRQIASRSPPHLQRINLVGNLADAADGYVRRPNVRGHQMDNGSLCTPT